MTYTRALSVVRLSQLTDDTTSPERQREHNEQTAERYGLEIVGVAEDTDVSATKFPPLARPQLGDWLRNRSDEFDTLIFWRLDRFVRSVADFAEMIKWIEARGKNLISATEPFDLQDPSGFGKAMAQIIAVFAELEARTITARVRDGHRRLRAEGRWPGGPPPYGYLSVPREGGGKCLVPDPETSKHVREAADMLLDGYSLVGIARVFNERGIETNLDRLARQVGREIKERHYWTQGGTLRILRNPATMGIQTTGRTPKERRVVRDEHGRPRRVAEPLLEQDLWDRVQRILDERSITRSRTTSDSPLLGLLTCGKCGRGLYHKHKKSQSGKVHRYYVCIPSRGKPACKGPYHYAEVVEQFIEDQFLNADLGDGVLLGELEVERQVFVPGENHDKEIELIERAIRELIADRRVGLYSSAVAEKEYRQQMEALEKDYERLSALPSLPDEYRPEGTGETFRQLWERLEGDVTGRRDLLKATGIRLTVNSTRPVDMEIYVPGELRERAQKHVRELSPTYTGT